MGTPQPAPQPDLAAIEAEINALTPEGRTEDLQRTDARIAALRAIARRSSGERAELAALQARRRLLITALGRRRGPGAGRPREQRSLVAALEEARATLAEPPATRPVARGIVRNLVDNVDLLLAQLAPLMAMATVLPSDAPAETPVATIGPYRFTAAQLRVLVSLLAESER
jgi:hypothetical protein